MTPQEWAKKVVEVSQHPTESSVILLDGGHEVPLDGRPQKEGQAWLNSIQLGEGVRDAITDVVRRAVAEAMNSGMPGIPLSAEDLEVIRKRHAATTQRPWIHRDEFDVCANRGSDIPRIIIATTDPDVMPHYLESNSQMIANAAFIAAAHQDIPTLLAHIDSLEGLLRDLATLDQEGAYRRGYEDGVKYVATA